MYMASQSGPHTADSIREIISQLRDTPMFAGKVEDDEAEELARLIEEKYGISMGLGAIVDAEDFRPWLHDVGRVQLDAYKGTLRPSKDVWS